MRKLLFALVGLGILAGAYYLSIRATPDEDVLADCLRRVEGGILPIAARREDRFLGKVTEETANCRGGARALARRGTPWVDWSNYWSAGDLTSLTEADSVTGIVEGFRNERGLTGALLDIEYQRIELIKFNLFDSDTYPEYVTGRAGVGGRALKTWDAMRLPEGHPEYEAVGGADEQICSGRLIRSRTLTGICNDIKNPAMGSSGRLFGRNVQFEETFPRLGHGEIVRNRHGDRLGLLKPDPQVISRKLFTRAQSRPELCADGAGLPSDAKAASCDYKKAPFFNVLAAFWIQFMTHDWFAHLDEGRNQPQLEDAGCKSQRVGNVPTPLSPEQALELGCRPDATVERALIAQDGAPQSFEHEGVTRLARSHRTTRNHTTAWWDASQIYGHDERSLARVKRHPSDRAKLAMITSAGDSLGTLPAFETCADATPDCVPDPINPEWIGQEATAFPDNWSIGLSFYHNVFTREHNVFVDAFRARALRKPEADSGLRDPSDPDRVIRHRDVSDDELFDVARLVVAAEIAKIHTIEWTTQLLYNEPLYTGMNANWHGVLKEFASLKKILDRITTAGLGSSQKEKAATGWYSVFASGAGIVGLGSTRRDWDLRNPDHVNGGVNHFGAPFNFPEEFVTVYRLHPLVPDLIEYRSLEEGSNQIRARIPVVDTFRGRATAEMRHRGVANWGLSMGRQRLGALALENHPAFLQNLPIARLPTKLDVAALDILRDRERGIPRFNEFRRQIGLRHLTSFDDFIDQRLPGDSAERADQVRLAASLREVYGQHRCDVSKVITSARLDDDGDAITDCLGHEHGTLVDNIEDLDTVVGWLAETTRPHGYAISETQFHIFILNASRRLFSDRFFTSSYRPEFYSDFGLAWVNDNGPDGKVMERGRPNGHEDEVSPLKRILQRTIPELRDELEQVVNVFDPWARDRGEYYSLAWKPRRGAESDEAFAGE